MIKNSTKKIPRLRFKGFEGEWEEKRLGDVGRIKMNKRIFKNETSPNNDIPFYKISTFGNEPKTFITLNKFLEYKNKYPYPNKGDILLSAAGTLGKTVVYNGQNAYYQDSNIVWLDINKDIILNPFLLQFYKQHNWNNIEGSTIKRLYNRDILDTKINLPKLKEQRKIGSFFFKLDQLIDLQSKKVEQLKKLKRGYLQKMFPQKGESVPRLRFNGFSGEWKEKKLKDISFSVSSSLTSKSILKNGNYPLYDASGVIGYINEFYSEHRYLSIIKDGSSAGKIKLMPKFTSVTGTMNYINSKDTNILFLYYLISTLNIKKFKLGTGIPHIYFKDYSKIPLFVPSLSEQRKIGEFLYNLDKNVRIIFSNIYCIKELKEAYLQKIFC